MTDHEIVMIRITRIKVLNIATQININDLTNRFSHFNQIPDPQKMEKPPTCMAQIWVADEKIPHPPSFE